MSGILLLVIGAVLILFAYLFRWGFTQPFIDQLSKSSGRHRTVFEYLDTISLFTSILEARQLAIQHNTSVPAEVQLHIGALVGGALCIVAAFFV
ncbi:MAG: hypothetical protein AAF351_08555 [Pseudomonadota bacterium]